MGWCAVRARVWDWIGEGKGEGGIASFSCSMTMHGEVEERVCSFATGGLLWYLQYGMRGQAERIVACGTELPCAPVYYI